MPSRSLTARPMWPIRRGRTVISGLGLDRVLERPDLLDHDPDGVARLQVDGWVAEVPDPCGGPGRDHVARLERGELRDVLDQAGDVEDHLGGARALHRLAVHLELDLKGAGIGDLVAGDQLGSERSRAVEVLA